MAPQKPQQKEYNPDLCDERHDTINKGLEDIKGFCLELKTGQQEIHNKLFVDEGDKESHQSKINRHDRWIKGVTAAVALLGVPVAILIVEEIIHLIEFIISKV